MINFEIQLQMILYL